MRHVTLDLFLLYLSEVCNKINVFFVLIHRERLRSHFRKKNMYLLVLQGLHELAEIQLLDSLFT